MKTRLVTTARHCIVMLLLLCSAAFHVRAQSGEPIGTSPFTITSLDYAYDKLILSCFDGDYSTKGILGKTISERGSHTVTTARDQVELGTGPGWSFYYKDRAGVVSVHRLFLITEGGRIYRKTLKDPPLDMASYQPVVSTWHLRSKEIPILTTSDQAYNWLIHQRFGHTVGNRRIYLFPKSVTDRISIPIGSDTIAMEGGPGWLFFVEYWPRETWGHNYGSFVLVTESGNIVSRSAASPPVDLPDYIELTAPIPATPNATRSVRSVDHSTPSAGMRAAAASPSNRWAVIISGGGSTNSNRPRYWNDCSLFYKTLMAHGFLDNHVFVLISDGIDPADDQSDNTSSPLDLDGDGDDDIQLSAERANITTVFDWLTALLDEDDILYIFTTDHGFSSFVNSDCLFDIPTAELTLWNSPAIDDWDLANEINHVTTLATVCIFEQCYSGGMLDDLMGANRVLMSGARFWETSKMGTSGEACATYDEYAYHVIDALGTPARADRDENGVVSMEEAHFNALANKHKESEEIDPPVGGYPCNYNPGEHPSYYSNPWDLGRQISLHGLSRGLVPPLMGSYIQEEVSESFPSGGVAQGWHDLDDSHHEYDLPFTFPFYGESYSSIWIGINGIIYFADPGSNDFDNSIAGLKSERAIAPLWDDLQTFTEDGDDIFISWNDPWLTIRWQVHTGADVIPRPVNVAAKLNRNGTIRFLYGEGNRHTTLIEQRDKTIGLSKGDGSDFILCLRNGAADLGFAEGIEFTPHEFVFVDGGWGGPHHGTRDNPFGTIMDGYDAIDQWGTVFIRGGSYTHSSDVPSTMSKRIQLINYDGTVSIGE